MAEERVIKQGARTKYIIKCAKCGYEWLSYSPKPKRCANCNNVDPSKPYAERKYGK